MKKYILAIDNGSQSTKVALYDLEGNEASYGSFPLREPLTPAPGVVEHPDDDLWHSVTKAIEQCLKNFQGDLEHIIGIGLCTIRCCRVLLNEQFQLASPVMSWMDARLNAPYRHEDEHVHYVTTTSGYINFRLTGEIKDSAANYEVHWPLDYRTLNWFEDEAKIAAFGLKRSMLFELVKPGEKLGNLRKELAEKWGLPSAIPVVATANDKAVDVLGSGIHDESTMMISLGTFISAMTLSDYYFDNAKSFFPTLASIPFKYVYETNGIRRGMWTVSWFKKLIGENLLLQSNKNSMSEEGYLNKMAEGIPVGSDGLITILDWLPPPSAPYRKGIMLGFDQRHTAFHIYRSILEAIAFNIKNNVDEMLDETDGKMERIIINGGGAKSDVLAQIIADLFNLPVMRRKGSSSACLGAAICTAKYLNIYETFSAASEAMIRTEKIFYPNSNNHVLYNRINEQVIKKVRQHTDEILKLSYPIFQ
ncbi:FGGY family carbohydrate kinase [Metasolibacillus sp. FSL K6-0083]|uniref:FGGY-family carbohydrate kinase n=1 Tax=Metasolibacillus sp. FSL K6-0083 TaxID=2921416 RepID=UPI0031599F95